MKSEFIATLLQSLQQDIFIKASLTDYQGSEADLKKIYIRRITVKREDRLNFTYRYKTRDIFKNHSFDEAAQILEKRMGEFRQASIFTSQNDFFYEEGKTKPVKKPPSASAPPSTQHDRAKHRLLNTENKTYLHDLKITDEEGKVYKNAQDKFRQINKYIEIIDPLTRDIPGDLKIVDMGSGKGYLTFALYDYLAGQGRRVRMEGVEYRNEMVTLCNDIARRSKFDNLSFFQGSIGDYNFRDFNVLIALHACDTATDDAIYKGIEAEAELIVVSPCCHKQIRREMEKSHRNDNLNFILKHGILMERQAEMVTDSIRALILEYAGYKTRIFEFISSEHTAKNMMIVAERKMKPGDPDILKNIKKAKEFFGIGSHHLEKALKIQ